MIRFKSNSFRKFLVLSLFVYSLWGSAGLSTPSPSKNEAAYPISRIVSLTVGSDEILLELLKSEEDIKRIAALSTFVDKPSYSASTEQAKKIKGRVGAQIESIINLKPDLVICAPYTNPDTLNKLKELKLNYLKLNGFSSLKGIKDNILEIGANILKPREAQKLAQKLNTITEVKSLKGKTFINYHPSGFIMGKDTIIDSLLSQMGLKNAVTQKGWPKISVESLLQLNPDFIIAAGNPNDLSKTTKVLKSKTGWKHFKAVKHGKIILIEPSLLSSTSHHIVKTYSQLKTKLTNKTKKN